MTIVKLNRIFVVINPAAREQYALMRAAEIAKRRDAEIIAHLCIYSDLETSDPKELQEVEIARHQAWLEEHLKPVRKLGIKVTAEIVWDEDWQAEVGKAAKRVKPDLIVKTSGRSQRRRLQMLSSDWALFERATCPVLLVNPSVARTNVILMTIDINREDKKYQEIADLVIQHAKSVVTTRKAEGLHVVNAYVDQDDYVHVADVAKRVGVPTKNVHVVGGQPEQAIAQVANKIKAEMVIMGLSTKSRLANRIFGYTSEWLLNNLVQDVLVIIPKKYE